MTETADMTDAATRVRSIGYRTGWWILVVITGGSVLNHLLGPLTGFAEGDAEVFVFFSLAALNTYTMVVLLTGYRRGERWAWWVTWTMIVIYAMTTLYAPEAGRYYQGAAVVMAVAQLLTWSGFRQQVRSGLRG
jgi:hypothetical protein